MIVSEGERNRERDSINAGLNVDFRGSSTGAIYGMIELHWGQSVSVI